MISKPRRLNLLLPLCIDSSMVNRPYDWVFFDSTGTLMRPVPEPAEVYHQIGQAFGSDLSVSQLREQLKEAMKTHFLGDTVDLPTDQTFERERWRRIVVDTISDLPETHLDEAFAQLWLRFSEADAWQLFADSVPTLQRLRTAGYKIALASNFDQRLVQILHQMQIMDRFDRIVISADLGWSKPSKKFYEAAQQAVSATDVSRLLMVGDTFQGDVQTPRSVGWDARHLVRDKDNALETLLADL